MASRRKKKRQLIRTKIIETLMWIFRYKGWLVNTKDPNQIKYREGS